MTLLNADVLWNLAWILPLAAILFYYAFRKRTGLLRRFMGKRADDPAYVNSSPVLRFWRGVIFLSVLALLVIAAARPSWGMSLLPYSGQGRDLMVVFDVSKSMLSQDVRPSRLEHAKWLVRQLCQRNPGDRFGLIAFAGDAFLECPLTIDTTSFLQCADELSPDSIPVGGTNIQQALAVAIRGFRAAETPHRAIILITDGDELTGDSSRALSEIVKLKIPLFILGVGDPSQPAVVQLPDENGGIRTLKDRNGNAVSVPLNEKKLAELARQTGGIYVRSTTTHPGLDPIENRIRQLEKHEIDSGKQTRPIERPLYPLLAAFALLCLWLILGERKIRTARIRVQVWLLAVLLGFAFESSAQTPGPAKAPSAQPPAEKEPVQVKDLAPEEIYNAGLKAQTQEKDLAKAIQLYQQAIAAANAAAEVRGRSAQNLGVMTHQQARAQYQQAQNILRQQQLDPALQQLETSLKQLAAAETIYKNALRETGDSAAVSRNQHQLISDRRKTEELKKKIEELKKQQQQARQNTRQALNQQQKQNQQKQEQNQQKPEQKQQKPEQQNKQNQSSQDQQKQNQQKPEQQNKQNQSSQDQQKQEQNKQNQSSQDRQNQSRQDQQNQQQTEKALESVKQLEQQAKELDQKQLEEQTKKAGEELDKARQAQEKNQNEKAEEHLKKALEQLGGDQQDQPDKQGKNNQDKQDKQGKDKQDKQGKDKQDRPLPGEGQQKPARPVQPEKEIDKDQAENLLELMAGDEKKLKDELKARMKRNHEMRPVEKDW